MKTLSILAVFSLATGPIPMGDGESPATLTLGLCNGGEITIPIGDDKGEDPRDCHSMACHAASREKAKRFSKGNLI